MQLVSKLGGRKLLLGLLVIGIGITIDATFGLGENLLYLLIFVAGGFFLGNVGEHVCDTIKKKADAANGVPLNAVANVVNQIEAKLDMITESEAQLKQNVEAVTKVTQSNVEAVNAILNVLRAGR